MRPRVFARPQKDGVGVRGGFFRHRRDMEAAERHVRASTPIVVGQAIRAVRRRDVNLNDDQIGCIIQPELLDVFVLNLGLIAVAQVCRESGEAERGE